MVGLNTSVVTVLRQFYAVFFIPNVSDVPLAGTFCPLLARRSGLNSLVNGLVVCIYSNVLGISEYKRVSLFSKVSLKSLVFFRLSCVCFHGLMLVVEPSLAGFVGTHNFCFVVAAASV